MKKFILQFREKITKYEYGNLINTEQYSSWENIYTTNNLNDVEDSKKTFERINKDREYRIIDEFIL